MHKPSVILCLLWAFAVGAEELPAPPPVSALRVTIAAGPEAVTNGGLARNAIARDGTTTGLCAGAFDFGQFATRLGKHPTIQGSGRQTVLVNSGATFSAASCCWELGAGVTRISDLVLRSDVREGQQSQTFGTQGRAAVSDATAILERVRIEGCSFALYTWGGERNWIIAKDCEILAGRWAVTAGGGSGPFAQQIDLLNCHIACDYEPRIGAGGDIGPTQGGVVARGGQVRMRGGSITCKGSPKCEKMAAVWASSQPHPASAWPAGSKWPSVIVEGVTARVEPNGTPDWCDVRCDVGEVTVFGGTGSGPNGEWITKGNVAVHGAGQVRK